MRSFDYDPQAVACTAELKHRYFPEAEDWKVEPGSVLDTDYLSGLGQFDIVYSWGVLHHTGDMWKALENVASLVKEEGQLFISIYNKQELYSSYWKRIKRLYNRSPKIIQQGLVYFFWFFFASRGFVVDVLKSKNPLSRYRNVQKRGMSFYYDTVDWVGGWPFEVAAPEEVFRFLKKRGFVLTDLVTCGGKLGCNEFVFTKNSKIAP